ncbi:MAG: nucleotidyltransferase family protein [Gemmataceae bacterium]|nr:nucleotidyltransferase family protein [Gemmataceae bacterium]
MTMELTWSLDRARAPRRNCWSDVAVFILAGGLGTRLRPVVPDVPKVLAPVGGRPYLAHLLERLAETGLRQAVLLTGYQAEAIEAAFGDRFGLLTLRYSRESTPLGTAGAARLGLAKTDAATIVLMNGDSWCAVDLLALVRRHKRRRADATMVITSVPDVSRYGAVRCDASDRVVGFAEKNEGGGPGWINAGIYVIRRPLLAALPSGRPLALERDVLPKWLSRTKVVAYRSLGPFLDIGTPESYAAASAFFRTGVQRRTVGAEVRKVE